MSRPRDIMGFALAAGLLIIIAAAFGTKKAEAATPPPEPPPPPPPSPEPAPAPAPAPTPAPAKPKAKAKAKPAGQTQAQAKAQVESLIAKLGSNATVGQVYVAYQAAYDYDKRYGGLTATVLTLKERWDRMKAEAEKVSETASRLEAAGVATDLPKQEAGGTFGLGIDPIQVAAYPKIELTGLGDTMTAAYGPRIELGQEPILDPVTGEPTGALAGIGVEFIDGLGRKKRKLSRKQKEAIRARIAARRRRLAEMEADLTEEPTAEEGESPTEALIDGIGKKKKKRRKLSKKQKAALRRRAEARRKMLARAEQAVDEAPLADESEEGAAEPISVNINVAPSEGDEGGEEMIPSDYES